MTSSDAGDALAEVIPQWRVLTGSVDLELPRDWESEVARCADESAEHVHLERVASTTLPEFDDGPLDHWVVDGLSIAAIIPWLDNWYRGRLAVIVGEQYCPAEDPQSGITLNVFTAQSNYRWHVDTNHLTVILFGNTLDPADGGALRFRVRGSDLDVQPVSGLAIAFDGRATPHTVGPISPNARVKRRLSLAFNFYLRGEQQSRPRELNEEIYGRRTVENRVLDTSDVAMRTDG